MSVSPELRRLGAPHIEQYRTAVGKNYGLEKLDFDKEKPQVATPMQNPAARSCSPAWGDNPNGCKFFGADPDGDYCGHPKSLAITGFGLSTSAMGREGLCNFGKRELWEPKDA